MLRTLILLFLTSSLLIGCATSPTGRRQLMLVSEQDAIVASKEAYLTQMKELEAKGVLNTDPGDVARGSRMCS